MNELKIIVNEQLALEYDRSTQLDDSKLAFLDSMDSDMAKGIKIQGELIQNPDAQQRGRFVVMNLIRALQQENEAIIQASCAYLINRFPQLSEVQISDGEGTINIELVEETVN